MIETRSFSHHAATINVNDVFIRGKEWSFSLPNAHSESKPLRDDKNAHGFQKNIRRFDLHNDPDAGICGLSKISIYIAIQTGAGGRNRTGTGLSALRIFIPATTFAAPLTRVWGLDYPFAIAVGRVSNQA